MNVLYHFLIFSYNWCDLSSFFQLLWFLPVPDFPTGIICACMWPGVRIMHTNVGEYVDLYAHYFVTEISFSLSCWSCPAHFQPNINPVIKVLPTLQLAKPSPGVKVHVHHKNNSAFGFLIYKPSFRSENIKIRNIKA